MATNICRASRFSLLSSLATLAKSGAIVSTAGSALLVSFVAVLLVFPVSKQCKNEKCTFISTAPEPLGAIVNQGFLATSLLTIAAGILMIRYSRWRISKSASKS